MCTTLFPLWNNIQNLQKFMFWLIFNNALSPNNKKMFKCYPAPNQTIWKLSGQNSLKHTYFNFIVDIIYIKSFKREQRYPYINNCRYLFQKTVSGTPSFPSDWKWDTEKRVFCYSLCPFIHKIQHKCKNISFLAHYVLFILRGITYLENTTGIGRDMLYRLQLKTEIRFLFLCAYSF